MNRINEQILISFYTIDSLFYKTAEKNTDLLKKIASSFGVDDKSEQAMLCNIVSTSEFKNINNVFDYNEVMRLIDYKNKNNDPLIFTNKQEFTLNCMGKGYNQIKLNDTDTMFVGLKTHQDDLLFKFEYSQEINERFIIALLYLNGIYVNKDIKKAHKILIECLKWNHIPSALVLLASENIDQFTYSIIYSLLFFKNKIDEYESLFSKYIFKYTDTIVKYPSIINNYISFNNENIKYNQDIIDITYSNLLCNNQKNKIVINQDLITIISNLSLYKDEKSSLNQSSYDSLSKTRKSEIDIVKSSIYAQKNCVETPFPLFVYNNIDEYKILIFNIQLVFQNYKIVTIDLNNIIYEELQNTLNSFIITKQAQYKNQSIIIVIDNFNNKSQNYKKMETILKSKIKNEFFININAQIYTNLYNVNFILLSNSTKSSISNIEHYKNIYINNITKDDKILFINTYLKECAIKNNKNLLTIPNDILNVLTTKDLNFIKEFIFHAYQTDFLDISLLRKIEQNYDDFNNKLSLLF